LLRTDPIWSYHYLTRIIVFLIGLLTVVIASISEKTQSNIKGQIAYASITQVGFMFIELSFGLETLVLVHFLGNAFLRCYQLLVSPSIVAHLLRVEGSADTDFFIKSDTHYAFLPNSIRNTLPEVLQNTLYVFSLQEGNLELVVRALVWEPLKRTGLTINAIRTWIKVLSGIAAFGIVLVAFEGIGIDQKYLAIPVSIGMVLASLSAFGQINKPISVWTAIALSSIMAGIAVLFLNPLAKQDVLIFLSGIIPAWVLGVGVLYRLLKNQDPAESFFSYQAMAETQPKLSVLLFISFLCLVGFPISPAFLGEDLLLSHASNHDPWFALPITIAFIINGIAGARVFQRLCMGRPTELCEEHQWATAEAKSDNSSDPPIFEPDNQHLQPESHYTAHPIIHLSTICGQKLADADQARTVIQAVATYDTRWIGLDFTGISTVSEPFCHEFMLRLDTDIANVWLVPQNYHQDNKLVRTLISRIQHLREQVWRNSFDPV
jgi:NADH-quinone oxidoreductase subunit L